LVRVRKGFDKSSRAFLSGDDPGEIPTTAHQSAVDFPYFLKAELFVELFVRLTVNLDMR
jgi:hypothetical protein